VEPGRADPVVATDTLSTPSLAAIKIASGAARVDLVPALGGSITAFSWRGKAVLRVTPPEALAAFNVRGASCYPLVPYANRIRDARLVFAGRQHALTRNFGDHPHSIHGVGWQSAWDTIDHGDTRATLALVHDARGESAAAWPWPFRATQTFDLTASADRASLSTTLTIENTGAAPFPFGLGWHPFFPRDATATLAFGAEHVWINDPTQLPVERIASSGKWSFERPRPCGEDAIDNVFCGFGGRATLRSSAGMTITTLEADSACRFLVV
jgi:aldose 1-epimerase